MTARKPKASHKPAGRPKGSDTFKPNYLVQARKACEAGFTDRELADLFDVNEQTINAWKIAHPEFSQALKMAKEIPDERVQRSLYQRAVGYSYPSEKVFQYEGEIVRASVTVHVPPDTAACFIWLKNRRAWRDRQEIEVGGPGDFDRMSDAELREFVASGAARQGAGDTDAASPRGKGASSRARRLN